MVHSISLLLLVIFAKVSTGTTTDRYDSHVDDHSRYFAPKENAIAKVKLFNFNEQVTTTSSSLETRIVDLTEKVISNPPRSEDLAEYNINTDLLYHNSPLQTCPSLDKPCLSLCCPFGFHLHGTNCTNDNRTVPLPEVYTSKLELANITTDRTNFFFVAWDPCHRGKRYPLSPTKYPDERFFLLDNGSIYKPFFMDGEVLNFTEYCLTLVKDRDEYLVLFCYYTKNKNTEVPVGMIISVPFLVTTFFVYTVVPELKSLHGLTLRGYTGSLAIAYTILAIVKMTPQENVSQTTCISLAFIIHFSFLASFFWLNVMCFDIWWTFGGFRSLQGSIKQRERKKFFIYSVYAWGSASILTGVCMAMDLIPNVPEYLIRPEFGVVSCWFHTDGAKAVYFYGPMGITVVCNICLFISTALKIIRHKKDTAHHLKGTDSRRHDDNKQWFNLYLKLFIVMGINWSMEIISWLCKDTPKYLWYITDLGNTLQGLIIFIIFVWKDKIKRLLLKRFGCQSHHFLSRDSTRSTHHSTASRATYATSCTTCTTSTPLQEKPNSYIEVTDTSCRRNGRQTDDSDDAA